MFFFGRISSVSHHCSVFSNFVQLRRPAAQSAECEARGIDVTQLTSLDILYIIIYTNDDVAEGDEDDDDDDEDEDEDEDDHEDEDGHDDGNSSRHFEECLRKSLKTKHTN